jgi:hypothetical protein
VQDNRLSCPSRAFPEITAPDRATQFYRCPASAPNFDKA